jgi:hypothetical protein
MSERKNKPAFIITIDTEGDNLWDQPEVITTKNTHFLPRFQALCEKYGFKPTYLTNYEMAIDDEFVEFGRDVISRGVGEIGMHLHAWNSPPIKPLTKDDFNHQPYLIEFPKQVIFEKAKFMTDLLEERFGTKMTSHRAGRWAFNEEYASVLKSLGYEVDCSVTPGISWQQYLGDPDGQGGSDYSKFPNKAYVMDERNIAKEAGSSETASLVQVPMTVLRYREKVGRLMDNYFPSMKLFNKVRDKFSPQFMFRSQLGNHDLLKWAVKHNVENGAGYLEYMLHSSEFMPGGSPNFKDEKEIEQLFDELEQTFESIAECFQGQTLTEFSEFYVESLNE